MYQNRKKAGFTLAEVLAVTGILSILLSVGMLSIQIYSKNLEITEMDATAKQIFIAAQNHMTALKASGKWDTYATKTNSYLGESMTEKPSDYPADQQWETGSSGSSNREYYVIQHQSGESNLTSTVLEGILPQNAIDDEIRNNGNYIIEYDYTTATVYGVFYTNSSERIDYENDIMGTNGLDAQQGRQTGKDGKEIRKNYKNHSGTRVVIGYYGGATSRNLSTVTLKEPKIEVDNGDVLSVTIEDKNYGERYEDKNLGNIGTLKTQIEVEVTGEESGASKKVLLKLDDSGRKVNADQDTWWTVSSSSGGKKYTLILDDITKQGGHFADIFEGFIPGENILIEAICSTTQVLSNLTNATIYTNSLFDSTIEVEENGFTYLRAAISSVRHLQNLHPGISGLPVQASGSGNSRIVRSVEQIEDLDWKEFLNNNSLSSKKIYSFHKDNINAESVVADQAFYSIENRSIEFYEGSGKTLSNFVMTGSSNGNSGLFAEIGFVTSTQTLQVQNIVFDEVTSIGTSNGDAGVVLGTAKGNATFIAKNIQVLDPTVQGNGNVGGIVGTMKNGTLEACSVFLNNDDTEAKKASEKYKIGAYSDETKQYGTSYHIVSSNKSAGGLIGFLVQNQDSSEEKKTEVKDSFASIPVITSGSGAAGGLVGGNERRQTVITNSYSSGYTEEGLYTQSYSVASLGNTEAGGIIGKNTGNQVVIQNSYATGSVFGKLVGGFVGSDEARTTLYKNCYAVGLVTESTDDTTTKGAFAGKLLSEQAAVNSYYLSDSNQRLAGVGTGNDTFKGKEYDELITEVTFTDIYNEKGQKLTPSLSNNSVETYAYDVFYTEETYPFPVVTTTGYQKKETKTHYGDWPKKQEIARDGFEIGFVYYELLEDKNGNPDNTFYYHGWGGFQSDSEYDAGNYMEIFTEGEHLVNGLSREPDTYVREEGYVLLVREDVDINDLTVSINGQRSEAKSSFVKKEIDISKDFEGYAAYEFQSKSHFSNTTPEVVFGVPTDQYNPVWGPLTKKVGFILNPLFGDSIYLITQPGNANQYQIRSARHLANMASGTSLVNNAQSEFTQTMDIDLNRKVNGKKEDVNTISSFNATYRSKYYPNTDGNYKIVGLKTTLFGTIGFQGSVTNMTLMDVNISTGNKSQLFADLNQGTVRNLTIKNANLTNSSNIDGVVRENQSGTLDNIILDKISFKSSGYVNGFLNTNNNGKINKITMSNIEVQTQGKVNGFLEQSYGKIENVSISGLSVQTQSDINGFIHYNNGNTIDTITMTDITLNTSAKINGFLEQNEGKISSITMSNIMMSNESSLNGFVSSNNGGTITGITIDGMKLISKSNVNGFLSYSGGTISSVHITDLGIESDKAVNGFIENNNGSSLTDIVISNLSIQSKTVANGFVKNNSGTLKGIQILSLDMRGEETANGFVETNSYQGVIESSVIHPQNASKTAYQNVVLNGNTVIGFVNQNQGSIKNSYIVGSFEGKDKVAGFVHTNAGTIAASYVNGIITAEQIASGFLLYNNSGEISNSFVVGEVSAKNEGGHAAGFVYEHTQKYAGTYNKCYTALWNLSATNIYKFGFVHSGTNVNESFWLADTKVTGNEVSPPSGESWDRFEVKASSISYSELAQKASGNPEFVTHKYNSGISGTDTATAVYPFAVVSTSSAYQQVQFWGDWPKEGVSTRAGLLYYEIVEEKLYYHGYLSTPNEKKRALEYKEVMTAGYEDTNGLIEETDKTISENGYIVLIPDTVVAEHVILQYGNKTKKLSEISTAVDNSMMKQLSKLKGYQAYRIKEGTLPKTFYEDRQSLLEGLHW